jgi:hypothetical protein
MSNVSRHNAVGTRVLFLKNVDNAQHQDQAG